MCEDDKTWERNEETDPYYGVEYAPGFFDNMNHIESDEFPFLTQADQSGETVKKDAFWSDIRDIIEQFFQKQPSLCIYGEVYENVQREFYYDLKDLEAMSRVADQIKKDEYVFPDDVNRVVYEFDPKFKTYPEEAPYVIELVEGNASGHTYYDLIISSVSGFKVVSDLMDELEVRLMVREEPLLILTLLDSDCSIRHENDGRCFFTKKINRMMIHERKFADLMVQLFSKLSARANIYESVADCIRRDHICQIPFPLKKIEKYETAADLVRDNIPRWMIRDVDVDDMNYFLCLAELSANIDEQDRPMILVLSNTIRLFCLVSDNPFLSFVCHWYRFHFFNQGTDVEVVGFWAARYAERCRLNNRKASLRISSLEELKRIARG